jgi:hypothetical protein
MTFNPLTLPPFNSSYKRVLDRVRSPKPVTILVGIFAIWAFSFFVKFYREIRNFQDLQGRLRVAYGSYLPHSQNYQRILDCVNRADFFSPLNVDAFFECLDNMNPIESLTCLERYVVERPSAGVSQEVDQQGLEGSSADNPVRSLYLLRNSSNEAILKIAFKLLLKTDASFLPENNFKASSNWNISSVIPHLLLPVAVAVHFLNLAWGEKSPILLSVLSDLFKEHLPESYQTGLKNTFMLHIAKRIISNQFECLDIWKKKIDKFDSLHRKKIDMICVALLVHFTYRLMNELPSVKLPFIPSNIISSPTVCYCENLNSRASTGEYNNKLANRDLIGDLKRKLQASPGVFLNGPRGCGISALIQSFVQQATLEDTHSIFSLNLAELRSEREGDEGLFNYFQIERLRNLVTGEPISTKSKIKEMVSVLSSKVDNPVLVIDNLQMFDLWDPSLLKETLCNLIHQINVQNRNSKTSRIQVIIAFSCNEEDNELLAFLKRLLIEVNENKLANLTICSSSEAQTVEALKKYFDTEENSPYFLLEDFPWTEAYRLIKECYPGCIMPGKAVEVIESSLSFFKEKTIEEEASNPSCFSKIKGKSEESVALKRLAILHEQNLRSLLVGPNTLTQSSLGYLPRKLKDDVLVLKAAQTWLIVKQLLIPKRRSEIEKLIQQLETTTNEIFQLNTKKFLIDMQTQRNLFLYPPSSMNAGIVKFEKSFKKLYVGDQFLVEKLFIPFQKLKYLNHMAPLNVPGTIQDFPPTSFFLERKFDLIVPILESFAGTIQKHMGLIPKVLTLEIKRTLTFSEQIGKIKSAINENPCTHVILKLEESLKSKELKDFLKILRGEDHSSHWWSYATFYIISESKGMLDDIRTGVNNNSPENLKVADIENAHTVISPPDLIRDAVYSEAQKEELMRKSLASLHNFLLRKNTLINLECSELAIKALVKIADDQNIPVNRYMHFLKGFYLKFVKLEVEKTTSAPEMMPHPRTPSDGYNTPDVEDVRSEGLVPNVLFEEVDNTYNLGGMFNKKVSWFTAEDRAGAPLTSFTQLEKMLGSNVQIYALVLAISSP